MLRQVVRECVAVAAADGIALDAAALDADVERIAHSMATQMSSTARDLLRGHPTGWTTSMAMWSRVPTPTACRHRSTTRCKRWCTCWSRDAALEHLRARRRDDGGQTATIRDHAEDTYVLTLSCQDKPGIVHAVSGFLLEQGGNIEEAAQFNGRDGGPFSCACNSPARATTHPPCAAR